MRACAYVLACCMTDSQQIYAVPDLWGLPLLVVGNKSGRWNAIASSAVRSRFCWHHPVRVPSADCVCNTSPELAFRHAVPVPTTLCLLVDDADAFVGGAVGGRAQLARG